MTFARSWVAEGVFVVSLAWCWWKGSALSGTHLHEDPYETRGRLKVAEARYHVETVDGNIIT